MAQMKELNPFYPEHEPSESITCCAHIWAWIYLVVVACQLKQIRYSALPCQKDAWTYSVSQFLSFLYLAFSANLFSSSGGPQRTHHLWQCYQTGHPHALASQAQNSYVPCPECECSSTEGPLVVVIPSWPSQAKCIGMAHQAGTRIPTRVDLVLD
ncbi:hypothetical protein J3A83DRAFT_4251953 [Scleroderma citrinum]